jgi:hypothetical protein
MKSLLFIRFILHQVYVCPWISIQCKDDQGLATILADLLKSLIVDLQVLLLDNEEIKGPIRAASVRKKPWDNKKVTTVYVIVSPVRMYTGYYGLVAVPPLTTKFTSQHIGTYTQ